jgi:amidase
MDDNLGAFCRHTHVALSGAGAGQLVGLTFAVKDVFDIGGHRTGAGHPEWLRTHPPAATTAPAVQCLLDAGARMVGKTHTDELTYSLNGENVHYGTPINPRAAGRIPGGSSSGSAAAVAGGLVDFALGTDCGGSVRLPASYCGIFGFRPTHGRIPLDGVVPLASSFDTVGWFARDAALLERVGHVLLADHRGALQPRRLLLASDTFVLAGDAVAKALQPAVAALSAAVGQVEEVKVGAKDLSAWMGLFRILQGAEIWANHGAWIRAVQPTFGAGIRERFEWTSSINPAEVAAAREKREQVAARLDALLGDDAILCLPTAPGIAPLRGTPSADLEAFRARALSLLCIAGLARLPQVSLPLGTLEGCPLGLSLVGPRGADTLLLFTAFFSLPEKVKGES